MVCYIFVSEISVKQNQRKCFLFLNFVHYVLSIEIFTLFKLIRILSNDLNYWLNNLVRRSSFLHQTFCSKPKCSDSLRSALNISRSTARIIPQRENFFTLSNRPIASFYSLIVRTNLFKSAKQW